MFLSGILSTFHICRRTKGTFFTVSHSSLFRRGLQVVFLGTPVVSGNGITRALSLYMETLMTTISQSLTVGRVVVVQCYFQDSLLFRYDTLRVGACSTPIFTPPVFLITGVPSVFRPDVPSIPLRHVDFKVTSGVGDSVGRDSTRDTCRLTLQVLFLRVDFHYNKLDVRHDRGPLVPRVAPRHGTP